MRLMAESMEQPIDKFVRHKENIQDWYNEMKSYNLSSENVMVLEEHLKQVYGVGSSQEEMMLLLMDERICGFSIIEANIARRVVGKKEMDKIPEVKEMIFNKCKNESLAKYIWETQIAPQMGYSFSNLHSTAYSLIALQEMNLAHFYPRIIWDVSCLTVSAGADEGNANNKSTDYGRVASAIGQLKAQGVSVVLPLINQAGFGFAPDIENNRIIYGLKGINTVNDDLIKSIIQNRPYFSFDDFYERMYQTGLIKQAQLIQLIKAGCFNEFGKQKEIMREFAIKEVDIKDKLNGQNMLRIIKLGLLNGKEELHFKHLFEFRRILKKNSTKNEENKKLLYTTTKKQIDFLMVNYPHEILFNQKECGNYLIDENAFEREHKKIMEPFMDSLNSKEFLSKFNNAQFLEIWREVASGSVESWQMEAVSFYENKHELDHINKNLYDIANYFELSPAPIIESEYEWNGRTRQNFKLFNLVGTILDKNKNSHTVTILTPDGVVTGKMWSGSFSHYDRQIKIDGKIAERSWFTRGNLVKVSGFRRGDQFVIRNRGRGSHSINLITGINEQGRIGVQEERIRV